MKEANEMYLGDGLYARDEGYQIRLRAPRSDGDQMVYLDPHVLDAFLVFIEHSRGVKIAVEKAVSRE